MAVFVDSGEARVIDAILADIAHYFKWGTGSLAETKGVTDLETPSAEARALASETDNGDNYDSVATITSAGSQTISEVGVFDHASAGVLLVYDTFTGIAVEDGDAIQFTMNFEIA